MIWYNQIRGGNAFIEDDKLFQHQFSRNQVLIGNNGQTSSILGARLVDAGVHTKANSASAKQCLGHQECAKK